MSLSEQAIDRRSSTFGAVLLEIRGLRVEGQSDEAWHEIVKGVDLTLRRGEVLGLIGESGATWSSSSALAICARTRGPRSSAAGDT